jgi:hypothetical protein
METFGLNNERRQNYPVCIQGFEMKDEPTFSQNERFCRKLVARMEIFTPRENRTIDGRQSKSQTTHVRIPFKKWLHSCQCETAKKIKNAASQTNECRRRPSALGAFVNEEALIHYLGRKGDYLPSY